MKISKKIIALIIIIVAIIASYFAYTQYTFIIEKSEKEKVLIIAADDAEPITLDPHVAYSTDSMRVNRLVYEKLLDYKPGSLTEFVPALAERWEISSDQKTYTFYLRRNVKFHNGEIFNAEAVRFSFERLKGIGKGPSWFLVAPVDKVEVIDEYTIRFVLSDVYTDFLHRIAAAWGFYIMPPSWVKEHSTTDDPWAEKYCYDHMVGTGPYKLSEWKHHDRVVLVKNDEYWGGWTGKHIEKIVIREVKEPTTQRMLLEKGEVDIAYGITIKDSLDLKKNPDIEAVIEPSFNTLYIFMHCGRAPLNDVRVRKAISYAYDYKAAIESALYGTGRQMRGPLPSTLWGWDPNCLIYETNLDEAKRLLAEAGYAEGIKRTLVYTYPSGDDPKRIAGEVLKSSLAKLGINVELKAMVWAEQAAEAKNPDTAPDFFSLYWWPDYADPVDYLYAMFHTSMQGENGYNWMYYSNPKVDEILDKATLTPDVNERMEMYKELQRILTEEAPSIYVFELPFNMAMRKWVKGFVYSPLFIGSFNVYEMYKEI